MKKTLEEIKKDYALDVQVDGMSSVKYMAHLLERNEKAEIDLERVRESNKTLKQMNNHSRNIIDAVRMELRRAEVV